MITTTDHQFWSESAHSVQVHPNGTSRIVGAGAGCRHTLLGMRVGNLELQQDLTPSGWVTDRLHGFAVDVGSIVPDSFEAYVRLFHPAFRFQAGEEVPVSWAQIAAANGRIVHAEMQWANVSGLWEHSGERAPGLWDQEPDVGTLPRSYAAILAEVLRAHTSAPDQVWFCVWEGWGGLWIHPAGRSTLYSTGRPRERRRGRHFIRRFRRSHEMPPPAPRVHIPNRAYYLLSGPIDAIEESMEQPPAWQSANLWWPDDRTWCVATEIDFAWTYVGGSDELVAELLAHPSLEGIRTRTDHAITHQADQLNPPPPRHP